MEQQVDQENMVEELQEDQLLKVMVQVVLEELKHMQAMVETLDKVDMDLTIAADTAVPEAAAGTVAVDLAFDLCQGLVNCQEQVFRFGGFGAQEYVIAHRYSDFNDAEVTLLLLAQPDLHLGVRQEVAAHLFGLLFASLPFGFLLD